MPIKNVDRFELLLTLKAILRHNTVVGAARERGITQSAASKHLAKLRSWFDDDLFVRTSSRLQPTEKALAIGKKADVILANVEALNQTEMFDPSRLEGEFVISTTDEVAYRMLPSLLRRIEKENASVRLTMIPLEKDYSREKLEQGHVDLVISVNWHAPAMLVQKRLYRDRFVCLMSKKHPLANIAITLENYAMAAHAMVASLGMRGGFIDDILAQKNMRRFIKTSVPSFSLINHSLLSDNTIATLPHGVACIAAKSGDLVVRDLPVDLPMIDYFMFWHQRHRNSQSNMWLRNIVSETITLQA